MIPAQNPEKGVGGNSETYASVTASCSSRIRVAGGPTVEMPTSTSFLIVPDEDGFKKHTSSKATMETVCKVLKPSEHALRINKISLAHKNGIRIEANSPDMERVKSLPKLKDKGLKVIDKVIDK